MAKKEKISVEKLSIEIPIREVFHGLMAFAEERNAFGVLLKVLNQFKPAIEEKTKNGGGKHG